MSSEILLYIAAILTIIIGILHSVLGERYLLVPLFRLGKLPILFGGKEFTIRTLRFAWHLTTIAWFGFAVLLIASAHPPISTRTVGAVVGIVFLIHFLVALIGSRGKHLSWIVFLLIGILAIYVLV